jgi:RimJ/RimL family protein N-acetyltransferase
MDETAPPVVALRAVDEDTLERMIAVALRDASANQVTPPVTPGEEWTPERVEWLRTSHRECRAGLDGPRAEATWAVLADGEVVGAVRLKRTDVPGVVETGIWLTRSVRGRGVGQQAVGAVVDEAAACGARVLRAETTRGNAAALALLRRLGFRLTREDDRVAAEVVLRRPDGSGSPERQEPQVG